MDKSAYLNGRALTSFISPAYEHLYFKVLDLDGNDHEKKAYVKRSTAIVWRFAYLEIDANIHLLWA